MTAPLLTARELAEQLGVSTGALLRWTRNGEVPAVKLPSGAVRYRPEAIEAWLEQRAMLGNGGRGLDPASAPPSVMLSPAAAAAARDLDALPLPSLAHKGAPAARPRSGADTEGEIFDAD